MNSIAQTNDSLIIWNASAIELYSQGKFLEAINFLDSKKSEYFTHKRTNQHDLVLFYQIKAVSARDLRLHKECIEISTEAMKFIEAENLFDQNFRQYASFLKYISHNLSVMHDYFRALNFVHKGLEFNRLYENDPIVIIQYLNMAGIIYGNMNDQIKSIEYYQKTLEVYKDVEGTDKYSKAYVLQNLSQNYFELNQPDSSIHYLEQSIKFQEAHPDVFQNDFFSLYATAANRYSSIGNIEKAVDYYKKAEQHLVENAPLTEIAHFYQVGSKIDGLQNNFSLAFHKIQKAKALLSLRGNKTRTLYPSEYFSMLTTLLDIKEQEYKSSKGVELAQAYFKESTNALDQAQNILQTISSDAVKSVIINDTKGIFRHAIHSAYTLKEKHGVSIPSDKLLFIFDSYQSMLIYKELDQRSWLSQNDIEPGLQTKLEAFEHTYDSLLHASYQVPYDTDIGSDYQLVSKAIYQTEDSLRLFDDILRTSYPSYHALMSQQDTLDQSDLAALFTHAKSLLTYFQYEDELFIYHLSRSQNQLLRIAIDDEFRIILARWTKNMSESQADGLGSESFMTQTKLLHEDGYFLYQQLIKPIENGLSHSTLIIPDGDIAPIAFGALNRTIPSAPANYTEANYLIEDYEFSTHFSLKLAAQMIRQINPKTQAAYSFVPNQGALNIPDPLTQDTMHLASLPYSLSEGQLIHRLFKGQLRTRGITADSLIREIKSSSLLHIGSHVVLNHSFPDQSYIPFKNDQEELVTIKPYELFNQPLGIDLVIVNSCHSGKGKSTMGRGLLSFVSGFAMADVKSILSSKWAVHDKMGFSLLSNIAQKLKDHQSIGQSLRSTQLQTLHRNDPIASHPSFWASYYLIGDTNIKIGGPSTLLKWILGGALLVLLAFIGYKKMRVHPNT